MCLDSVSRVEQKAVSGHKRVRKIALIYQPIDPRHRDLRRQPIINSPGPRSHADNQIITLNGLVGFEDPRFIPSFSTQRDRILPRSGELGSGDTGYLVLRIKEETGGSAEDEVRVAGFDSGGEESVSEQEWMDLGGCFGGSCHRDSKSKTRYDEQREEKTNP